MDKLDLIRKVIKVAGNCTNQTTTAGVLKTICVELAPSVIDFVDERHKLNAIKKAEMSDAPSKFDAFDSEPQKEEQVAVAGE